MGFGLVITCGDDLTPLSEEITQWLVEVRVESDLSKPTRFAMRFEDDLCEDKPAVEGRKELAANKKLGVFVSRNDKLECLVYGPVTDTKSSSMIGGAGSWVEIHGEDRRVEMGRVAVQHAYTGRASTAAEGILKAHKFKDDVQKTLIEYDKDKNKLTQRGTDLSFLEDIARRNNMEFWISYQAEKQRTGKIELTEQANLRTSPTRSQSLDKPPVIATLKPDAEGKRVLKVNPPPGDCPTVNKFEAKIDYEKPTAASGFAPSEKESPSVVEQIIKEVSEPIDKEKPLPINGVERELLPPPAATEEEAYLKKETIVYEQSWFVEVECSTTLDQLDFVVLPHQIIKVANAGPRLSGGYQVTKTVHVVTATDHFMDFTLRANGLGES